MPEEIAQDTLPRTNGNGSTPPTAEKRRHRALKRTLTAADWADIEAMAGAGIAMHKIAKVMDLSERTLRRWRRVAPSFQAACEKGFIRTEAEIGKALAQKAKAGDLGAIVWWEKTRAGRRDSTDVTSGGRPLGNITYVIQSAAGALLDTVEPEVDRPEPKQLGAG